MTWIDEKEARIVRDMWRAGDSVEAIGNAIGASKGATAHRIRKLELPKRKRGANRGPRKKVVNAPKPAPEEPERPVSSPLEPRPDFPEDRDLDLMMCDGTYRSIAAFSQRWAVPIQKIQARLHLLNAYRRNGGWSAYT